MWRCMYVCAGVRIHERASVYLGARVCMHCTCVHVLRVCMCMCMCVFMFVCACRCADVCVGAPAVTKEPVVIGSFKLHIPFALILINICKELVVENNGTSIK